VAGEPEINQGDDAGGTVGHDAGDDVSGDQAAWRDLVTRLELPAYVDPATAPWPARENLGDTPAGQTTGGAATSAADPDPLQAATDQPEPAAGTSSGSGGSSSGTRSGQGSGTDRSRVIRPASFIPFTAEQSAAVSGAQAYTPENRRDQDSTAEADFPDYETGADFETDADLLGFGDEDLDDRYIPPPVPSLPRLDPIARGAWTALFGGPGYLFVATLLSWQVPGWAELAAIIAFVAGFTILVVRLGDGPSRRDGPDQGAVV
jgi:hypothetical protein